MAKKHLGKVHIYTGDGKGKTTAALGLALRAVGRDYKVVMIQFMKGEVLKGLVKKLKIDMTVYHFGQENFVTADSVSEEDKESAQDGLECAQQVMAEQKPDILILDEINMAVHFKLLPVEEVEKFIADWRDKGTEIVLTGQKAHPDLIEQADLVTEMEKVKHYFDKDIEAREGIEF